MTSAARLKAGNFSRSPRGLRRWFAVHSRALVRKKAPRAATACPAAVLPAGALAIVADSLTVPRGTDKLVEEAQLLSAPQRSGLGTAIPMKATR